MTKKKKKKKKKREREGSLGQNHTSHPERDCISIIFVSFSFLSRGGVSLPFRNCTRSNTGRCLFFCLETTVPFPLGGAFTVELEGIWIGGIDWIGLDGCEGGPEMVNGWEWERRTYVRTVLYYCVVCQPAVPACFTWYWRLVSGWYGMEW
jgi:hypothetical protein